MADSLQHIALQRHLENTYSRELPALDRCKQNAITADKRIRFEQEVGASVAYQMPCHVSRPRVPAVGISHESESDATQVIKRVATQQAVAARLRGNTRRGFRVGTCTTSSE